MGANSHVGIPAREEAARVLPTNPQDLRFRFSVLESYFFVFTKQEAKAWLVVRRTGCDCHM